ncbi:SDR family oxidoreductase [Leekyejoonella antrihumi]|uniref:SDR family oxidoreductase n=1 Tax=Leekyejoonella antrihumi TaxID=1660198 RepID=A0A563E1W0_9MICO|nr:SDR family oxidoreductase [Leekyejoonella antrihumi]TWP36172.1 SDR family oxidoreductase [Leekyejoonella antrihumi]
MRVFVTGGSGWIGSALIPELVAAGHHVLALARSDASAEAVTELGAHALRGDLTDTTIVSSGAADTDGVIHLAYRHDLGQAAGAEADAAAINAFIDTLAGTDKPLVVTGATLRRRGRVATERDELVPEGPIAARIVNLRTAHAAAQRGIRTSLVMIPRSVHGEGERHGFIPQLIDRARDKRVSGYTGDGANRWPAVHVKDAATLYRLALERAPAGSIQYAVGDQGVAVREIAAAIGRHLDIPARSLPPTDFVPPLSMVLGADMPASSTITQQSLGWTPTHPGLIDDIESGHYFT